MYKGWKHDGQLLRTVWPRIWSSYVQPLGKRSCCLKEMQQHFHKVFEKGIKLCHANPASGLYRAMHLMRKGEDVACTRAFSNQGSSVAVLELTGRPAPWGPVSVLISEDIRVVVSVPCRCKHPVLLLGQVNSNLSRDTCHPHPNFLI